MAGIYGNSPYDRAMEAELDRYLESQEVPDYSRLENDMELEVNWDFYDEDDGFSHFDINTRKELPDRIIVDVEVGEDNTWNYMQWHRFYQPLYMAFDVDGINFDLEQQFDKY